MKFYPHNYQMHGIGLQLSMDSLALFWDMGLGKSVVTLTAYNDLKFNRFAAGRALVIAPKKVAEATWSREAAKWDHLKHLRVIPVLGTERQRIRALHTPGDVWVINRDNVVWLTEYYRNAWPFDVVICDEYSSFKNPDAKRTKALRNVRPHIKRFIGLTGTPAPNGLMDLWSQVYLLDGGERLGKTFGGFKARYFDHNEYTHEFKAKGDAEKAIWERIGDICFSLQSKDYLDLPERIDRVVPILLDAKAQAAYTRLEREAVLEMDDAEITASSAAALTNKLLQLCNGAAYDESRRVVPIHDCKIEALMELIEGLNGKPALVFYSYQHDLPRIHAALAKAKLRVRELRKPEDELAWNRREVDVLLAHPASAAYGLNLQEGGNHVVWFGLNWSLELYQQANARLHRQGQTEKVIVHHLVVQGGADEDVMAALGDKGETQERLMRALRARVDRIRKEGVA